MKHKLLLLFLAIGLFFISCVKNETEDIIKKNNPPIAKSEYLKKLIIGIDEYNFTYDTLDRVIKFEYGEVNSTSVGEYDFEYSGSKLMNIYIKTQDVINGKLVFESHNTQGLPTIASVYYDYGNGNGMELQETYNYIYEDERIKSIRMLKLESGVLILKYEKKYFFQNENLVKQMNYYNINDSLELFYTYEFSYDANNNPGAMFGLLKIDYLSLNFDEFNLFPSISICDINNYTSRTKYDKDGNINKDYSIVRTFEYNSKDYPYKCTTSNINNTFVAHSEYKY